MTLGFSTHINGQPTNFVEKIWRGLCSNDFQYAEFQLLKYSELRREQLGEPIMVQVVGSDKIHTIREDKNDRWKPGNKIHMVTGNRTKKRFQFAPVLKVQSVQRISIYWGDVMPNEPSCYIDGECIAMGYAAKNWEKLAINDGFDSTEEFFKWFNEDFHGKIINWTDFKYN